MITSVKFASLFLLLGHLRCGATDKAELERLKKAYEAREAAQTEDIIYSFEFNKSAEIRATRKTVFYKTDYTYDTMEQFTNVPESFEPKVSEPYNRHQLWRIFNWYDKDKNEEKDNPYAKKYNKVVDRVKWFYKKLILDVEAQGKVDEETRWDAVQNRSAYQRRRLGKVEQLKQRLNWYGTPRTTSEKSILHRYLLQNTMNEDRGRCTESVSPWYKLHPPYTIADGRHLFWTWFDGSPEKRIPYAHPDYIYYDPRYEGLESAPINWTAREMDPLPWAKRRILGGYSNKWLWPPRTTPTDFWRPSKPTTWDISERSDYIYIYDEKNPRKIQYTKMESQMRDRMDSMAYEYWKSAEYRRRRKLFEEERAELLRDNNLTDSYSPEKRVLSALRAEVDPSRVLPGMHSAADRAIQKFARHFVACFAPTRRIWFNEELTLKPRFVANSSRRTVCPFDELYPTIVASNELTFYYTMKTTSTTPVSMESLYDGLDTTEEKDELDNTRVESRTARTAQDRANANLKVNKALDALSKLTTLTKASEKRKEMKDEVSDVAAKQRGRPKKGEVEKESKGKSALRKSKVNKPRDTEVKSKRLLKRAKRNVRKTTVVDPEDDYVPMVAEDSKDVKERGSKDEDTGEVMKHRMDEEDQKNYQEIQEQYERLQQRKANISKARFYDVKETTLKKKRKPTYHYTSLDEQEAERKWNEVQKKKALKGGGGKNKNKKRKQREVTDTVDEIEPLNRQFGGQTIITTFENSTPPFEYFQQKVYPSHNLSSAQLNDEEFCRKLIPILEEENKMLMNDIKRRATEHGMEMRAAQVNVSNISELNEDESSETEGTTQPMTTLQRRKRDSANNRYKIQIDNIYSFETIMTRKKREINQTNDEKLNKLKRNLEVYNLVDEWKEKQVDLAMVSSKERRLLNEIDRLRKEMNMSHGENDPWYKQAVTEAIRRENELKLKFKDEIDEWWSKERKERRAHEKEVIEKYYNQTDQNDNEDFDKEEERKNQEELNIIKQEHEKDMAERKAKGLPPDSYEKMLPIAEEEMAEEQKKYEEECKCAPKTVDELMKEFDADVDVEKLKRNLEVYDLIEKWKKRQQKKDEQNKIASKRKKREVHIEKKLQRMKRKTGKDSDGEYVEDMSRYRAGKRIYKELHHKMKGYKGAGESGAVNDVMSDYMKNKKYDNPDYRKKRDLYLNNSEEKVQSRKKRFVKESEESEQFDASDLDRIDRINAKLRKEGYDREAIMKESNVRKNEKGELEGELNVNEETMVRKRRFVTENEESEQFDASDFDRIDRINAKLRKEGYDRDAIMKESNVRKNEKDELEGELNVNEETMVRKRRFVTENEESEQFDASDLDRIDRINAKLRKEGYDRDAIMKESKVRKNEKGELEGELNVNEETMVRKRRFVTENEESEQFDASDLDRIDRINAKLRKEGYDREAIMKESKVRKNEKGELEGELNVNEETMVRKKRNINERIIRFDEAAIRADLNRSDENDWPPENDRAEWDPSFLHGHRRRKRDITQDRCRRNNIQNYDIYSFETIMTRKKRDINQTNDEKLNKLKRNLEVYNLVDEWKEKQVDLAMVSSKERRLLNEIDRLRKEMNMSHGEDDPWYKQAVTEAIRRENELKLKFKDEIDEWWSKERKERRAHEKEVIEKYYNQTDQNDNEDFDKEEERKNQEELNIIKQEHEKDMAERKAKGLPPDSYEKMLPIAEEEMAEEQKKYEEECKCAPKTVDELMKEFDADVDVEKLKRNLEVYDLIEKWKKKQQEKEEKNKPRKKREIHGFNKRMKRKCENSQEDEDRSRGKGNEKVYQEFNYKLKNYKGENADDENTADVLKGLMKENAHLHATRKTGKPQDAVDTKIRDKWFKQVGDKKTYDRGLYFRDKRDIENRKWRYNKVENFEERNVAEVDDGSALLNIHRRKRDIKNRCKMHNDEKSERYDIEKLLARRKREIQANTEKLTKLKRNLEVYNLIDEWKEKQVDLEVYDLIENWKKRQQKKDEQNKIASKRKKREVHIEKKLQRIKRKTGKDSDGEYVEDMSRYRAGKRIYKELHHKMKGYKGAGESGAVNDVMSDYMKNKKYDNPDYRKKRDLTAIANRNCNQEDDFDIVDFHIRRYGNTSIYEYVGPPASQEKQLHQQQSWQQRCQKVAHMFGIENFKVDTIRRKDELEKTQKELAQDEMNTVLRRIHQRKRNKALLRKRRDALNVSMVDDGLPLNSSHTDDKHVHLENELDRMVREYEEQQKKSPRRPKTRPTASSEYPLKEDFEPFIKSSKELREFEEREQARERFALYKNFKDRIQEGDKLEQRQNDYLAEFDTTPSTTTISARAREKIQNLRSFIKSQLDDTVKKFSEALILLNATTGANVDQTDVNVTTPEERDIVYHKVYEHNPDELLHKTDVTFDIIERNAMLKTTTEQPQTFSPWATHIQNYNRFEYEPVNNETTVVIFSEDETVTYSPMYGFHRYYHDLNSSVDSRTVAPTTYAFLTKDKTDSFTLPSYDAEGTVFTYNIHEFDENKTPTIQSPWDISQKENLTLYKYPTELLIERYNTHITESTKLATQMETTGSDAIEIVNDPEIEKDISDIGKFSPPNMDEIKQYIDSVTKSRERFNKKNFEWDSENSAYTLIDETTTTKCPKIRQQNIEFIEALQNDGLRPSTREIITTELPTEKNTEETTVKTRGLKTYLQDILQKYSNEVPQGSAQKQENVRLKQQLLQILELESKMNKLDEKLQTNNKESTTFQSKTKRPRTTLFCGLKAKLFNLLHKYTEEILNTNAIANNQTKKKYGKMKNVIRILVDNYSPGPETDILDPAWTVELTSKERKAFPERNSTNTNDEYHINLKQQIHHVLDEYPDDNKHDKTLKIMVRKALRDSFENLDTSEIDDDVVFNQTNFWDVSDYVTNDVCTDRRFKTGFRVKLRKLIRDFSKEILSKNNDLTSRERRVNKNIIQNIGAAVEAYSFGPETDALAEHLQKIEVSDEQPTSPRPKPLEGVEEKKNLRLQIENFMNAYKSDEHENTIEKESNTKLKKLVQDLIKDHSFEYSLTAEMQGLVKRLTTKEEEVTVRTTTVLNTEEQREVEEERRRRVPTYDYYDDHEELATCKDPKTTLDYYELYKEKVTERTTTTLSESQQLRRDKYIKNVERMNHLLDQKVDEHAKKVLLQHTTKKRPRLTTPDSQETDETSEEEPFTYRTMGPIETRIEYEFSDSRDFEIPFHDITVTKYTERFEDGLYTPGQGFENRSTIPESDEYRRAQRPFRYELANPVFKDPNVPRYLVPLEMLTPETTTVDYYSFYRQKMKKTTTGATEPTKDPAALARYREKFIANVDAFNRKLSEEVAAAHTGRVSKVRPRLTTPDSEHTDEESEMEPFTFYTAQPTERRVEMEFSDSREYYVPLLGITLSTLLPYPENVYTPGQGFENRSTVPEDDEYARAQWRFKYDPQIEIDRQGLTFSHDLYTRTSRPPSSPSTPPTTLRPLHRLFARWRAWKDKPLGDRFDSLKQAVNKSRLGGQFDSLKQMVNSSLLSWKGKVDGFVNRIDRRAHRIIHAWYDVKDNCSVEH